MRCSRAGSREQEIEPYPASIAPRNQTPAWSGGARLPTQSFAPQTALPTQACEAAKPALAYPACETPSKNLGFVLVWKNTQLSNCGNARVKSSHRDVSVLILIPVSAVSSSTVNCRQLALYLCQERADQPAASWLLATTQSRPLLPNCWISNQLVNVAEKTEHFGLRQKIKPARTL